MEGAEANTYEVYFVYIDIYIHTHAHIHSLTLYSPIRHT